MKLNLHKSTYAALDRFGLVGLFGASGVALAVVAPAMGESKTFSNHAAQNNFFSKAIQAGDHIRRSEEKFFTHAFEFGLRQMRAASLALERSENPEVITAARALAEHHEKMTAELAQIACSHGCDVEHFLLAPNAMAELSRSEENSFQGDFLNTGALQQENLVALFEDGARGLSDADTRSFASRQLPVMLGDLSRIENLKKMLV